MADNRVPFDLKEAFSENFRNSPTTKMMYRRIVYERLWNQKNP